jgi:hypothetical protein
MPGASVQSRLAQAASNYSSAAIDVVTPLYGGGSCIVSIPQLLPEIASFPDAGRCACTLSAWAAFAWLSCSQDEWRKYPKEEAFMNLKRTVMVALSDAAQEADADPAKLSKQR